MKFAVQEPTLTTSPYTAGDGCGGLMTFDFGSRGSRTMSIDRAEILDTGATPDEAEMNLHLFTDPDFVVADADAFAISKSEWKQSEKVYVGKINFATYADGPVSGSKVATVTNVDMRIPLINGKIYGQLECVGTPTFEADQLAVKLHGEEYA